MPKEKFSKGVVIKVNEKGWMENEMIKSLITECFVKRPMVLSTVAESSSSCMRAHITTEVKDALETVNTTPAVIPDGMTKLLQPLDISVNRTFKMRMRSQWEKWMTSGEKSFTATDRLRRASLQEVAAWVANSAKSVPKTCVDNGFRKDEIFVYQEDTPMVESDTESEDDEPLIKLNTRITPELAELFHSDTEDEDFDGFSDSED
ncbi:unnamed protein product [Mytilus coruscus]|uniref:DDE-1 domain-containing protein n=1 Tax=Mytilus coruscus TaxID=42192 RepID=A0A6J8A1D0_MYTCO|nr:unnamed protein product [Mytilus coruscus]